MNNLIVPIVIWSVLGLICIAFIVVGGLVIKARVSSISTKAFTSVTTELKNSNVKILDELASMKENLNSIHKMMKEIE